MNLAAIETILRTAYANLMNSQRNFYKFTSETGLTEWNMAHHYANEVIRLVNVGRTDDEKYDCDVDVAKQSYDRKRPDIIVHRRGEQEMNFLAIEVKRTAEDALRELDRISDYWFASPLHYAFGAVVAFDEGEDFFVKVLTNPVPR